MDGTKKSNSISYKHRKLLFIFNLFDILRFYIDTTGNIRLRQIFILNSDKNYVYNLTIKATDQRGLNGYTNVAIFLNIMSINSLNQPSIFACSIDGVKSELNRFDKTSLNPPLFISVS